MICTYAYFDGPKAFKDLARELDQSPGLDVTLFLNIERGRGNTTASETLVQGFASRFWQSDWPGKARPRVYYDPQSLNSSGPKGVLHTKAVIADRESLFITSSNLTEAAMDRNIEMGVLLRDPAVATTAVTHFRGLIDQELPVPLPDFE